MIRCIIEADQQVSQVDKSEGWIDERCCNPVGRLVRVGVIIRFLCDFDLIKHLKQVPLPGIHKHQLTISCFIRVDFSNTLESLPALRQEPSFIMFAGLCRFHAGQCDRSFIQDIVEINIGNLADGLVQISIPAKQGWREPKHPEDDRGDCHSSQRDPIPWDAR